MVTTDVRRSPFYVLLIAALVSSVALGIVGLALFGYAVDLGRVLVFATLLLLVLVGTPLAARRGYRRVDATATSPRITAAEIEPVLAAEATLVIERRPAWKLWPRLFDVVVDGQRVAQIKNRDQVSVPVTVGPHTVRVLVDWCASRTVNIDPVDGDVIRLACRPSKGLRGSIKGTLRPEEYLELTDMNGGSAR